MILKDILVLDFSEYIAGPFCGFMLADLGARVIKIEPPDGAEERRIGGVPRYKGNTRMALAYNRGKESMAVDLRSEQGRELVYRLVKKADVIIQNFVPGVAEKLGIDYETLKAINEKIIFVSSTAFGEKGPYRTRKGFDIIAHAASGIMSHYADDDGEPRGPGGPAYIDMCTGMYNAFGVVSALYHRQQTGRGQKLETSLFGTGLTLQAMQMIAIDSLDENILKAEKELLATGHDQGKNHTQIVDEIAEMKLREDMPKSTRSIEVPACKHRPTDVHTYPYYRVYETKNGYISIAALNRKQRAKLCEVLSVVDEHLDSNVGAVADDAYFAQKEVMKKFEAALKARDNNDWLQILEEAGIPCGQVNYRTDLYDDPQAEALDLVWELENRDLGNYKSAGHPIGFSDSPVTPARGAPSLGEDTDAVLTELGCSEDERAQLREAGVIK